jgi:hypothetical protein
MKYYQVSIYINPNLDEQFWELLPEHRSIINQLMLDGKIITYSISTDRSKGWMTISAESQKDVRSIIKTFPIIDYLTFDIHELFIFDNTSTGLPQFILN